MSFDTFFKYFPPPKFLKPNHIGFSFSDSSFKLVEFSSRSSFFPLKVASEKIDSGTIISGRIIRSENFLKQIENVRTKFDSESVSFTIPDEFTYIYTASITAPLDAKDIYDNVFFTLEENVPLSPEDLVFDFAPVSFHKNGDFYKVEVVVFACLKKEIEVMLSVLNKAFPMICGCLPESQAISLAVVPKGMDDPNCVVYISDQKISVYFVKNRIVQFATFSNLVSKKPIDESLDEYKKFFDYLNKQSKNSEKIVKDVFVCGDFEFIKQLVPKLEALSFHSGKVMLSNVWSNLFGVGKFTPKVSYENSFQFAGALGSLLN